MKPDALLRINIAVRRFSTLLKSSGETDKSAAGFTAARV
jgi:hypothetical protein